MSRRIFVLALFVAYANALTVAPWERISDSPDVPHDDTPTVFNYAGGKLYHMTELGRMSSYDISASQWSEPTRFNLLDQTDYTERVFSMGGFLFNLHMPLVVERGREVPHPKLFVWDEQAGQFSRLPLHVDGYLQAEGSGYLRFVVAATNQDDDQAAYICTSVLSSNPYTAITKLDVKFSEGRPVRVIVKAVGVIPFLEQVFPAALTVKDQVIYIFVKNDYGYLKSDMAYTFDLRSNRQSSIQLDGLVGTIAIWDDWYYLRGQLVVFGTVVDDGSTDSTTAGTTEAFTGNTDHDWLTDAPTPPPFSEQATTESTTQITTEAYPNSGAIWSVDLSQGRWNLVVALPSWRGALGYTIDQKNEVLYLISTDRGVYSSRISF